MKTFSIQPSTKEAKNYIDCPICGGHDFAPYWTCDGFAYVKCRECSLLMQNPQPAFEALDDRYDEEYFKYEQKNDQLFFDLMLKGLSDVSFNPSTYDKSIKRSFLDVGCATGLLVEYMQNASWDSKGVELCGPAAVYGSEKRNIDIFTGTVEQAAYSDSSFDVVHCSHLIEHLNDPDSFIDEVYRILKPNGLFICTTPNVSGLQARIFGSKWRSAIADHMFLFSGKTLKDLLRDKNFSVMRFKTWGGLGQGYGPIWIKKLLDYSAKRFSFGDVMIVSAEKK